MLYDIHSPKKETPRLFICKFWNDQMECRKDLCLIFILTIKLNYTAQEKLLPNFLKFKLNKRGVSFLGECTWVNIWEKGANILGNKEKLGKILDSHNRSPHNNHRKLCIFGKKKIQSFRNTWMQLLVYQNTGLMCNPYFPCTLAPFSQIFIHILLYTDDINEKLLWNRYNTTALWEYLCSIRFHTFITQT